MATSGTTTATNASSKIKHIDGSSFLVRFDEKRRVLGLAAGDGGVLVWLVALTVLTGEFDEND